MEETKKQLEDLKSHFVNNDSSELYSEIETLQTENLRLKSELDSIKAEAMKFKTQSSKSKTELNKLKKENERLLEELVKYDSESAKVDKKKKDVLFEEIQLEDEEEEEYCDLLSSWLETHNAQIQLSALAVFHGVKSKAKKLWSKISQVYTMKNFIHKWGIKKNFSFVENQDDATIYLGLPPPITLQKQSEPSEVTAVLETDNATLPAAIVKLDPQDDALIPLATTTSLPEPILDPETTFVKKVITWMEQKEGWASWNEFTLTFPDSLYKTKEEFIRFIKDKQAGVIFDIPSSSTMPEDNVTLVLKSHTEKVFVQMFCKYLKNNGGCVLASKFAHFVESVPGALLLKEKLPESKLANLARKYPEKLHFWRDGDVALCCLANERERFEKERNEKKRKEAEAKEAERLKSEKSEAEESKQRSTSQSYTNQVQPKMNPRWGPPPSMPVNPLPTQTIISQAPSPPIPPPHTIPQQYHAPTHPPNYASYPQTNQPYPQSYTPQQSYSHPFHPRQPEYSQNYYTDQYLHQHPRPPQQHSYYRRS